MQSFSVGKSGVPPLPPLSCILFSLRAEQQPPSQAGVLGTAASPLTLTLSPQRHPGRNPSRNLNSMHIAVGI